MTEEYEEDTGQGEWNDDYKQLIETIIKKKQFEVEMILKKFIDMGYPTVKSLATFLPMIAQSHDYLVSDLKDQDILDTLYQVLKNTEDTAVKRLEQRRNSLRLTTGSAALDDLFGGGVETGQIYELYGEYRTGKTQVCLQLCVSAQLPREMGGLNIDNEEPINVLYLDTNRTFRPERVISVTRRWEGELDVKEVLQSVQVVDIVNSDHLLLFLETKLIPTIEKYNIRLLIIDCFIAHFRAEYKGRGTIKERQEQISKGLQILTYLTSLYPDLAIILTNQVHTRPDMFFGDPTAPVGGHSYAHPVTTRIYLRKSNGERRIARIEHSPLLPGHETVFAITCDGIIDVN